MSKDKNEETKQDPREQQPSAPANSGTSASDAKPADSPKPSDSRPDWLGCGPTGFGGC